MSDAIGYAVYVGIDWGWERHEICWQDAQGGVIERRAVAHDPAAVSAEIDRWIAAAGGVPAAVAVAIETSRGALVETLLERQLSVWAINPKQLDRFRDRFSAAGAKDDRRDALVLADAVRTDRRAFVRVELETAQRTVLREHSRLYELLVQQRVAASHRLREQWLRFYPQLLTLGDPSEPWVWAVWELAPTPARAVGLRRARVQKLLSAYRIRRVPPAQVLTALRQPGFAVGPGTTEAAGAHVAVVIEQLRLLGRQMRHCQAQLQQLLEQCKRAEAAGAESDPGPAPRRGDVEIIDSLPGAGLIVTATLVSEAGRALSKRDLTTLRALCGSAPVTKRSGKSLLHITQRRACNPRLRNACHYMAQTALRCDALCHEQYRRLRAKGHSHGRALRGVADRLLRILIAALKAGTVYDIQHLNALESLVAATYPLAVPEH